MIARQNNWISAGSNQKKQLIVILGWSLNSLSDLDPSYSELSYCIIQTEAALYEKGATCLEVLHGILKEHYDEEEIRTLCFYLSVDYDDLPGKGKTSKARELLAHLKRRRRLSELVELGRRKRPDIPWELVKLLPSSPNARREN